MELFESMQQMGHEEVVFWVMGMRRYGHIVEVEDPTEEGYFRYKSVRQEETS